MKQILQSFKTGELWLAEVPAPLCRANGIVMRNRVSFVSAGTERMLVDFAKKSLVGKAIQMPDQVKKVIRKMKTEGVLETLEKVQTKLDQPIPLGYSSAGIVCEVDTRVEGIVAGDRVACGGAGFANHAEYNFVPKNLVVKLPDGVSFEDASCATVGSIAMQGIRQCDLRLGETVAIIGLGLLGMLALQMAKAAGCRVIGFDPNPERCKLALELGADAAVSEGLEDAAMAFSQGHGLDAVLITAATHSNEPVTVAAEICRMKGRVVATGLVGMNLPRDQYYKKELDFKLSLSYGPGRYDPVYEEGGIDYPFGYVRWTEQRNMQAFVDLVAMGKIHPGKLITHRFTFDSALDAYDLLLGKAHEPYLGVVLEYADADGAEKVIERRVNFANKTVAPEARADHAAGLSFIGCGNFAKAVLLPALKKHDNVKLRGLCTASGMSCGETAKKERFAFATTDQGEILKDAATNLVFVTTRHNLHAQQVCDCLNAGKNVFVEKPLALNCSQLDEVIAAAASSTANLTVGFNRRFSPHAKLIKDYFAKRAYPLMLRYHVNAGIIPKDVWIQDPGIGGGRMIGEGCHFIDFMSFVVGQPVVAVQAKCLQLDNAAIVAEDNVDVHLQFADGSLGVLSYVALGDTSLPKERCEIHGGESTAVMDNFTRTVCSGKLGSRKLKGKQQKGFRDELAAALDMARTGKPSIPLEQIVNVTRTTFAVLEALKSGGTVGV
ncbi:MAG: bi-domain-containing oxidoreductase [Kiritimatiellae bacterium]|nr:bi-domain-containing oxidoreductase [Kiritimatiellia bacterium]